MWFHWWYILIWLTIGLLSVYQLDWDIAGTWPKLFTLFLWPLMWLVNVIFLIIIPFMSKTNRKR